MESHVNGHPASYCCTAMLLPRCLAAVMLQLSAGAVALVMWQRWLAVVTALDC